MSKTEVQAATVTTGIPVYRMYNKATGEHLYTTDVNEARTLVNLPNSELAGQEVYLRVEGSARINGDSVDAKFENIKLKQGSTYDSSKIWGTYEFKTNTTISSVVHSWNNIEIQGTVTGLGNNEDWDNAYDRVSDIIQFVQ